MTVFDLQAILRLDKSQYEQGLNQAESETNGMSGKLSAGLLILSNLATSAIQSVGRASVSFVKDTVAVGMDFDKSMSQVAATMGKTVEEISDLRDFAQDMGRTTVFSATQAADALNYMALAGYDTQESMEMLPNVLSLAAAGNFDLARASDMVTDTQTAFGISAERTTQLVDEMAKAASTGNTSVEQLGDAFLVVGGLAQELNGGLVTLSDGSTASVDGIQELEIALTAMANAGVKGSEAGTHMRNMLLKLSSPTDEGVLMMNQLGVSVFDTEGKMRSLSDVFGDLSLSLSTLTQEEKIQAISSLFNTRDLASAEALLNAIDSDWNEIGESILNAQGAAEKMADTQLDNLAGDVTLFQSALEGARIAISDQLSPTLRQFVQFGTSAVSEITEAFQSNGFEGAMNAFTRYLSNGIDMMGEYLPTFIQGIANIVSGIVPAILNTLIKQAPAMIGAIAESLGNMIPGIAGALGNMLLNLPAMLVGTIDGLVNGISNMIGGIVDAIEKQAEDSIPEDLADGYVGKIQSNFEKSFSEGITNLKLSVANLIGNTEWADALEGIQLASAMQDKIISDYESAKQNLQQYSFESFQLKTEAEINTAMTLLGALEGLITDENGAINAQDLGVAQTYVDQINNILGEGAVELKETPAEWLLQIKDRYTNEDGTVNVGDPSIIKSDIESYLNTIFASEESIDLNTQTYNAVSQVLSGYTEQDAIADKENIKQSIQTILEQGGVPTVDAEVIANAAISDGAIYTWYNTGRSTSWDNSEFIAWMQREGYLPTDANPAKTEAIAEVATKFVMGDINEQELADQLKELGLTDDEIQQAIKFTVDYSQVNDAIKSLKEMEAQQYKNQLISILVDSQINTVKDFTDAMKEANSAKEAFESSPTAPELEEFISHVNTATLALNSEKEMSDEVYGSLWDLMGGIDGYTNKEAYLEAMLNENQGFQNRAEELNVLKDVLVDHAETLIETAGGYEQLGSDAKKSVDKILGLTNSWSEVSSIMGLTAEQTATLKTAFDEMKTQGIDPNISSIGEWVSGMIDSEEGLGALTEASLLFGGNSATLAYILAALAENEGLLTQSTDEASEAMSEAGESASSMSDGVEDAAEKVGDVSSTMGTNTKQVVDAMLAEMQKGAMKSSKVGTTMSSEFSGSFLTGQPTAVQRATNFIEASMNAMQVAFENRKPDVTGAADEVEAGIEESISPLAPSMSEHGDTAAGNLDESFGAWATTVGQTVTGMYQLFETAFGSLPDQMSIWGEQIGDYFYTAFSTSDVYSVISDASSIADGMVAAVSDLSDSMYWQFYYAGQGAYNGFTEWATPLINAARNTANQLIAETARGLDNHSPSKEMRKQYGYAGEGAYLGWLDWSDKIIDAVEGTGEEVTGALDYSAEYPSSVYVPDQNSALSQNDQKEILNLLMMYLPQLVNRDIVLDSGRTVGELMPTINNQMESNLDLARRGVHA